MSNHRKDSDRPRAGGDATGGASGRPSPAGDRRDGVRHDRLDTIEQADDRTAALDPHRGGVDEDPIDDLLNRGESNAEYREDARRTTPILGPEDEGGGDRDR